MKKVIYFLFLLFLLTACSNTDQSNENTSADTDQAAAPEMAMEMEHTEQSVIENREESASQEDTSQSPDHQDIPEMENRKIIYNANFYLETSHFNETTKFLEEQTNVYQGYIVSSNQSTRGEEERKFGSMTIRIPSEHFQEFISVMEDGDLKIRNRSITGEDVTEQYVDLTSRLQAKETVEERLLAFMEEAEKTEDLLQISSDLAEVQEEIEQLTGKINYLENQSDYATIVAEIEEKKVALPDMQDESLNTWEKTKEQFLASIQFILSALSSLFIFFVGNAPVFIVLAVLAFFLFLFIRKRRRSQREEV